jgi:dihydroorotate dehydrogenase (NAD+) catalytic subunit
VIPRPRHRTAGVDTTTRLGPLVLANPVIAASGTFGHGAELARLCPPAALGAVTVKSLAPFAWAGNPPLRTTEAPGGGMLNSVGLTGPGVAAWIADELPALRATGATVIASLWGRTVGDYAEGARLLGAAGDAVAAVEVNLSCPNLDGGKHMFAVDPDATAAVIAAVAQATDRPVFAKLTAAVTDIVVPARAAIDAGATGLTLVNTLLGLAIDAETRRPVLGAGGGGLSGPPIKPVALRAVSEVARALPGTPIIGTGGVTSGRDAVEMLLAGATAVGVGTATFAEPRATLRIVGELADWCARHRVATTAELTGGLQLP